MRALRDAWDRLRAGAWAAGQCGLAAAAAWAFSTGVLGHSRPFFASVVAVVSLGLTAGGRLRRTAELSAGVALGVAVGDAWVALFGLVTGIAGLVGMLRNLTPAVASVAAINNYLLPLWMIGFGVVLLRLGR